MPACMIIDTSGVESSGKLNLSIYSFTAIFCVYSNKVMWYYVHFYGVLDHQ